MALSRQQVEGIVLLEKLKQILSSGGCASVKFWCEPSENGGKAERIEYVSERDFVGRGTGYMRFADERNGGTFKVDFEGLQRVETTSRETYRRHKPRTKTGSNTN